MKLAIFLLFLAACGAKPGPIAEKPAEPPVDNAATRYTTALQQSVTKAEASAAKAQEAIARTQRNVDQANQLP